MGWFRNILFLGIIISLILTSFSFGQEDWQSYYHQEDILIESIKSMGAEFEELDIHFSGKYSDESLSKEEVIGLGRDVIKKLEPSGEIGEKFMEKDGIVEYKGVFGHKGLASVMVSSYSHDNEGKGETTIFVNLVKREKNSQNRDIIENAIDIFMQYGIKPEITTCVVGEIEGKLTRSDINKKIIRSVKRVNGEIVDNHNDENLVSVTAYTPILSNFIYSGNKKMNYNVAMRYNEYEEKTFIWIGTPIITINY